MIETGRAILTLEAGVALPWPAHPRSGRPALDLCGPCLAGLTAWLDIAPAPAIKAAG